MRVADALTKSRRCAPHASRLLASAGRMAGCEAREAAPARDRARIAAAAALPSGAGRYSAGKTTLGGELP